MTRLKRPIPQVVTDDMIVAGDPLTLCVCGRPRADHYRPGSTKGKKYPGGCCHPDSLCTGYKTASGSLTTTYQVVCSDTTPRETPKVWTQWSLEYTDREQAEATLERLIKERSPDSTYRVSLLAIRRDIVEMKEKKHRTKAA